MLEQRMVIYLTEEDMELLQKLAHWRFHSLEKMITELIRKEAKRLGINSRLQKDSPSFHRHGGKRF